MITEERLQEIKGKLTGFDGFVVGLEEVIDYGLELIAAYEQAQAELAEWKRHSDKVGETWQLKWAEDIANLRDQLAEARMGYNNALGVSNDRYMEIVNLRAQLAEARITSNNCEKRVDELTDEIAASHAVILKNSREHRKKLADAQTEIDHWKYEMPLLRESEM